MGPTCHSRRFRRVCPADWIQPEAVNLDKQSTYLLPPLPEGLDDPLPAFVPGNVIAPQKHALLGPVVVPATFVLTLPVGAGTREVVDTRHRDVADPADRAPHLGRRGCEAIVHQIRQVRAEGRLFAVLGLLEASHIGRGVHDGPGRPSRPRVQWHQTWPACRVGRRCRLGRQPSSPGTWPSGCSPTTSPVSVAAGIGDVLRGPCEAALDTTNLPAWAPPRTPPARSREPGSAGGCIPASRASCWGWGMRGVTGERTSWAGDLDA